MAVPPHESGQADLSLPAIAVGMQVHLLILDCSPQSFNEDVVVAALPSRPADSDSVSLQARHEVGVGELAPLIGVEHHNQSPLEMPAAGCLILNILVPRFKRNLT